MITRSRILAPAVWLFYVAIVFEFLFMITPFALYFYSAFTPAIAWLNATPWTAWLTGFFLPHFSQTSSVLLDGLGSLGWTLAYVGLALFLLSAAQLYGAKLFRRGAVTGLLYRYVRHPQYLALAVLGLGVTLIWPRFLTLVTFVTMLFLYRILARVEENHCLEKYGNAYLVYLGNTGMFLPRLRARRTGGPPAGIAGGSVSKGMAVYLGTIALALVGGMGLREYMLSSVSAVYLEETAILSPARLQRSELLDAYRIAGGDPGASIPISGAASPMLVYVVPGEWYLPDLPIDPHETVRQRGGHGTPADFDRRRYRVLFMAIRFHGEPPRRRGVVREAYAADPVTIVDVDMETETVVGVSTPPAGVIWGDISPPLL